MSQALEGIRVIDFTHDQAGPSCTQMLAWLGADVIKIERPPHGDRARRLWAAPDDPADSYFFLLLNSNKRSIVVDLKTGEGKEIARRLVREADVVAENLGPGVMERLGLGYEAVKVLNPRAVYASVKGFGSYGQYSDYKCFEPVAQATSGAMSVTGEADGPPAAQRRQHRRQRDRHAPRDRHPRGPRAPSPRPRAQAITPPVPHPAAPLEPQAQRVRVAYIGAKFGSATMTSWPRASRHRATHSTHSLSVEASITIRARGRDPSTAPKRSGSVRIRCSITSPPSARMKIWLSLLCTSMPIWSMAGLSLLRR